MTKNLLLTLFILCCASIPVFAASGRIITYNDVTLSNAVKLILPANLGRRTACCQNTGGTNAARIGDVNISGTQGWNLVGTGGTSAICFDTSDPIYGYSTSGTTVGCNEVLNP